MTLIMETLVKLYEQKPDEEGTRGNEWREIGVCVENSWFLFQSKGEKQSVLIEEVVSRERLFLCFILLCFF